MRGPLSSAEITKPCGAFHSHGGTPNSWMVFGREDPNLKKTKMDDLWNPPIALNPWFEACLGPQSYKQTAVIV